MGAAVHTLTLRPVETFSHEGSNGWLIPPAVWKVLSVRTRHRVHASRLHLHPCRARPTLSHVLTWRTACTPRRRRAWRPAFRRPAPKLVVLLRRGAPPGRGSASFCEIIFYVMSTMRGH